MRYCQADCEAMEVEQITLILHMKFMQTRQTRRMIAYDSSKAVNRVLAVKAEMERAATMKDVKRVSIPNGPMVVAHPPDAVVVEAMKPQVGNVRLVKRSEQ